MRVGFWNKVTYSGNGWSTAIATVEKQFPQGIGWREESANGIAMASGSTVQA